MPSEHGKDGTVRSLIGTAIDSAVIFLVVFLAALLGPAAANGLGWTNTPPNPIGSLIGASLAAGFKVSLYWAKIRGVDKEI